LESIESVVHPVQMKLCEIQRAQWLRQQCADVQAHPTVQNLLRLKDLSRRLVSGGEDGKSALAEICRFFWRSADRLTRVRMSSNI
jgi:hypothetical protein